MKWRSKLRLIGAAWLGIAIALSTPVRAQTVSASALPASIDQASQARLAADLAYPNSSQRFFEAGREQFEQEIQQLADEPSEPLLTVRPEVLEQFED